jgi:membrane-associated phospholipid phosphatase
VTVRQATPLAPPWATTVAAAAALVNGTISGLVWHSNRLPAVDAWAVRELEARDLLEFRAARAFSFSLASVAIGGTLAVAVLALVVLRWRNAVILAVAAPLLALAVETLLKHLVARRAPGSTQFHYPSGHVAVTSAAALAAALVVRAGEAGRSARSAAALAGLWVVAIALTRQVDQAHLLSDVVGGVATGVAATLVVALLLDRYLPNPSEETNR